MHRSSTATTALAFSYCQVARPRRRVQSLRLLRGWRFPVHRPEATMSCRLCRGRRGAPQVPVQVRSRRGSCICCPCHPRQQESNPTAHRLTDRRPQTGSHPTRGRARRLRVRRPAPDPHSGRSSPSPVTIRQEPSPKCAGWMPRHHDVRQADVNERRLGAVLALAHEPESSAGCDPGASSRGNTVRPPTDDDCVLSRAIAASTSASGDRPVSTSRVNRALFPSHLSSD